MNEKANKPVYGAFSPSEEEPGEHTLRVGETGRHLLMP